ncbi:MAG TPA: LysE family transporter [Methanomassiliicoccales archaeon]|nr:LysE family transporter [Methanomassiliicoccales archaeon]
MWEVLLGSAFVLAILMCAPPGAVNTQAFRKGITGGFPRALWTELGSCIGDLTWAALALIGLALLMTDRTAQLVLGICGAALLIYLAYQALKDSRKDLEIEGEVKGNGNDFVTGALISLGNPFQVAFWLGIGGSAIAVIVPDPEMIDYVIFFIGYALGCVIWSIGYSALVGYGRRYVTPRLFQVINVVCALVMLYFAASLLWATFA